MRRMLCLVLGAGVLLAFAISAPAAASAPGKIAFTSNRDGNDEIFVMNADGSGQTQITFTSAPVDNNGVAWSPDGKQLAFASDRNHNADTEIFLMNADGSNVRQLTSIPADGDDSGPHWSPDGKKLIFTRFLPGGVDSIVAMNPDGSGQTTITSGDDSSPTSTSGFAPNYSPDMQRIVFESFRDGDGEIFLMNADGSGQQQLTFNGPSANDNDRGPSFTADGKSILFSSDRDGDLDVFRMGLDGSTQTALTSNLLDDRGPSFSRDGLARIAFTGEPVGGQDQIFVMNADGTERTQLTFGSASAQSRGADWLTTATCGKKPATIIGTAASETLTGGPGADVISGQGGKDTINGLGGKDLICGDAGADKLNGGKGKDKLYGGKGNDRLNGGKGKDTCVGGKGSKDKAKGCEKEKKIP
jgi:Tol biopolymer transport system component